jgi:hypothetical protein
MPNDGGFGLINAGIVFSPVMVIGNAKAQKSSYFLSITLGIT